MTTGPELKDLFLEAIELPPRERRGFLSEIEARSATLFGRLEELLAAHARAEAASEAAQRTLEEEAVTPGLALPLSMGNYELLEELAAGGSGVVYRARQLDLGRTVAIKLLRSGRLASGEEVQRFRAEAEASARLDHPSIVPVHEVGTHEGRHFISMKLIDGPSLDQCVERFQEPRAAAELVARIARAVDHGHRHGVLHRDVKPSNVLLDKDGTPYVADFGTAKVLDDAARQTVTGWILGTPSYMAPEQAAASGDVTVATDVYALGCVLYELLVGRPPVVAAGLVETLRRVQEEAPAAVRSLRPEIHRDLETICHTCLAKEPARRYGSALALAQDLERWLAYEPIEARPASRVERLWLAWRRNPLVTSLIAAVALLAVVIVVGAAVAGFELRAGIEDTRAAEEFAREQLRNAYLAEARALRQGGQAGRRGRALELLGLAAEIRPGRDLLDEGVASLALSDIARRGAWQRSSDDQINVCFDGALEQYFVGRLSGESEVRRVEDDSLVARLEGNGLPAWRARFSPGGRYIGLVHHARSGGGGELTRIWDLEGPVALIDEPRVTSGHFDFAPDRPVLALCWDDGRLHELDLETLERRELVQVDPEDPPRVLRYAPHGRYLAVAHFEPGPVRVYDLEGRLRAELEAGDDAIRSMAWSPDGARLLAACDDHRAYVWEVDAGARVAVLEGHAAEVVRAAFPRHDLAATYSWDGTTRLWDLQNGETLSSTDETLHESPPGPGRLALATPDQLRIAPLVHGSVLRELHGHDQKFPEFLAVDPAGSWIASGGETEVLLWDLPTGRRLARLELSQILDLVALPDGTLLIASGEGIERWWVADGDFVQDPERVYPGRAKNPSVTPDGRLLAFLGDGFVNVLSLEDGTLEQRIVPSSGTSAITITPDGTRVAAGSYRGSGVRIWDVAGGVLQAHLLAQESDCKPQFSPDGRWLAVGTVREYLMFHVGSWELEYRVSRGGRNTGTAKVTRFSPGSDLLASVLGRSSIGLHEAVSGQVLAVLEPPSRQQFNEAHFTADGRFLVVASESNRVLVWDLVRLRQEVAAAGLDAGLGAGWTPAEGRR